MTAVTIQPTECITFPRSGHHLLVRLLKQYFGDDMLGYSESYTDPNRRLELDPSVRFQKNHDLQLGTSVRDDRRYIVQIRYPIDSLVSWYKWECENRRATDSPDAWVNFALQKTSFWMQFYRKWVLDYIPGRLIVNYADLLTKPDEALRRVVEHLTDETPDEARIAECCANEEIRQRNHYRGFKYYGESFFGMLKGLYAAVPGIDLASDRLVIPVESDGDDKSHDQTGAIVHELRQASRLINDLAERVNLNSAPASGSANPVNGAGVTSEPTVPAGV